MRSDPTEELTVLSTDIKSLQWDEDEPRNNERRWAV